ncbi:PaaI family thioesterase [Blastococcus sp. LR1]|uniref:PaaI family thioesterase n=1 Tax=Blastococcus sp. LR1 TaxID=2877000 RepID=UPI001CD005C7|nr:PaaI family thioesterase [Blastococcus sp. LR1]MCA0146795.1 PaaI family thioesterase [Blastococcus sp. LR1]
MSDDMATGGFAERLGARPEAAEDGSARLGFEATDEHLNPAGTLHGGVLATLVDTAMGLAVRTTTDDGEVPATSQLTVTYLRPGKPGRLEVTARLRTRGEHLTVCEADVEQDGKSLVHAVATFALLER